MRGDASSIFEVCVASDLRVARGSRPGFGCFHQGATDSARSKGGIDVPAFDEWPGRRSTTGSVLTAVELEEPHEVTTFLGHERDGVRITVLEVPSNLFLVTGESAWP